MIDPNKPQSFQRYSEPEIIATNEDTGREQAQTKDLADRRKTLLVESTRVIDEKGRLPLLTEEWIVDTRTWMEDMEQYAKCWGYPVRYVKDRMDPNGALLDALRFILKHYSPLNCRTNEGRSESPALVDDIPAKDVAEVTGELLDWHGFTFAQTATDLIIDVARACSVCDQKGIGRLVGPLEVVKIDSLDDLVRSGQFVEDAPTRYIIDRELHPMLFAFCQFAQIKTDGFDSRQGIVAEYRGCRVQWNLQNNGPGLFELRVQQGSISGELESFLGDPYAPAESDQGESENGILGDKCVVLKPMSGVIPGKRVIEWRSMALKIHNTHLNSTVAK